jgi:tetraacyldisaccharide 4'-kinase
MSVDPSKHTYLQVGDEPLLLARHAPTWAGPDRILSSQIAIDHGATVLIMDDGLQNNTIQKNLSFLVVDAVQKFGNNRIFPAGPLREPFEDSQKRAQAIIYIGNCSDTLDAPLRQFKAFVETKRSTEQGPVIAFCGMGYPEKFKQTLQDNGYSVVEFVIFADHHPYTITDMMQLIKLKNEHDGILITTSKDWLRVPQAYRPMVEVLPIELHFQEEEALGQFILKHIGAPAIKQKKKT